MVDPIGVLRPASRPTTAPTKRCIQIQVWLHQQLAHSNEQREARERALARDEPDPFPTTLLTSGSVAGTAVLGLPVTTLLHGANPSHFSLVYGPTDHLQPPTELHRTDVHHAYAAQLTALYAPIRTLDPDHVPSTTSSTSWVHLFRHPTAPVHEIRSAIVRAPQETRLPPYATGNSAHGT